MIRLHYMIVIGGTPPIRPREAQASEPRSIEVDEDASDDIERDC